MGSQQHGSDATGSAPADPFPDSDYWRDRLAREPYYRHGEDYDDYAAAYEAGWLARRRRPDSDFAAQEARVRHEWEATKGVSRLPWERARHAALRAWERAADEP